MQLRRIMSATVAVAHAVGRRQGSVAVSRAGAHSHLRFLLPARAGVARPQRHRLRHLRDRQSRQRRASSGSPTTRSCFTSPEFWQALKNTFYFAIVGGPLTIAVSLGTALLLNAKLVRFKSFFRTIYFTPFVTTLVAVAIVWRYLYHTRYGLLNYTLGHFGIGPIDWLGNPHWAMPAIILMSVWKNFGYNMLIFIAGLQAIPQISTTRPRSTAPARCADSSAVTLPLLGPTLFFVGVITMIGYFQLFSEPYVMTQGGPLRATTSVVLLMYEEGFRWWRMGYAAAIAFVLFIVILIATLLQFRLQKERV